MAIDTTEIEEAVRLAEQHLRATLDELQTAKQLARKAGFSRLAGEIDGYAIANLSAFLDGEHQMGSIESIRDGLANDAPDEDAA